MRRLALSLAIGILVGLSNPGFAQQDRRPGMLLANGPHYGPLVHLPGRAGRPSQRIYRNGLSQTTELGGGSRTEITVALPPRSVGTGPSVAIAAPTRSGITAELAQAFPGEVMTVVTRPMHNAHGQFGLAMGSRCLYAWQWIDNVSAEGDDSRGRLFSSSGSVPASVRVRLCGNGAPDRLVPLLQGLTVRDPFRVTRVAAPSRPATRRTVAVASPRPAPSRPVAEEPVVPTAPHTPAPGFGVVPVPGTDGSGGRRYLVPEGSVSAPGAPSPVRNVAPSLSPVPTVPRPAQSDGGRRYLVDRTTSPAPDAMPFVPRPAGERRSTP